MKELTVTPGDNITETFLKAWQIYHALERAHDREPVCFHLNDVRVIIVSDDSHSKTRMLTDEEAKKIFEAQNKEGSRPGTVCNKCKKTFDSCDHRIGWNAVKCPHCGNEQMHDF